MKSKFFGQFLISEGLVTKSELLQGLKLQEQNNQRFGTIAHNLGFMTEGQMSRIYNVQRYADSKFGEIAIKKGYLTEEQVNLVQSKQRFSHLNLGEALIKIRALTYNKLDDALIAFNQKSLPERPVETVIAQDIPHHQALELVIDMCCKMLTRLAGIHCRFGRAHWVDQCPANSVTIGGNFTGEHNIRFVVTASKKTRDILSQQILNSFGADLFSSKPNDDAFLEFINLVCKNAARKGTQLGYDIQAIGSWLGQDKIVYKKEEEIGLSFPVFLPNNDAIDFTFFARSQARSAA